MMKTKKYLTCDINRRIDMSNASRQPYPKGRAAQLGPHPSAAVSALAGGCPAIGPELLHLRAPGLSLPRTGTATQAPCVTPTMVHWMGSCSRLLRCKQRISCAIRTVD